MDLNNTLKALQGNFKLDPYILTMANELIVTSKVCDYKQLFEIILKSKKFDFLSKLEEAIEKAEHLEEQKIINDNPAIYIYSEKLYKKTCWCFNSINWQLKSKTTASLDNFEMGSVFDEKELSILNQVGDKRRLAHLENSNLQELESEIIRVVKEKTIQKYLPSSKQIGYKENPDKIDNKVLNLIGNK